MKNSLYVYSNGIQCLPEIVPNYNTNKIVFVGNMRTLHNQDAVLFFIENIFSDVKKTILNSVFYIIGAEPPTVIQRMADNKNIIVTGFVKSIEDEIKDAAVAVVPVRIAAGIQNKVLLAMACGVPVVLTSVVAASMPELISEKNCLIADKEQDFTAAVILLMQNENIRNGIAKNGYDLMKHSYSWNERLHGYEELDIPGT
jgi:glycosyltransferase involved in cell wall biosynthesis